MDPRPPEVPGAGLLPDEGPARPVPATAPHQGAVATTPPSVGKVAGLMSARGVDPETAGPLDTAVVGGSPSLATPFCPTATPLRGKAAAAATWPVPQTIAREAGPSTALRSAAADTLTAPPSTPQPFAIAEMEWVA